MPRYNKAADKRRSERFELRLTVDEAQELVTRAVSTGMFVSDFVRKSALGPNAYMEKAAPDDAAMINAITELTRIGNVLNQIISSGKYASSPQQAELLTETLLAVKNSSAHLIKKMSS